MATDHDDAISVEGQLRFSEFLSFNLWFIWRRFKRFLILIFFVAFVYPPLAIAGVLGPGGKAAEGKEWAYFIWPTILLLCFVGIYFGAKRAFSGNKLLNQPARFRFSSQGLDASGPLSSGTCKWEGILSAEESHSLFLLFFGEQQAYIVPKRYFGDASVLPQFRELLRAQLGGRARLRPGA